MPGFLGSDSMFGPFRPTIMSTLVGIVMMANSAGVVAFIFSALAKRSADESLRTAWIQKDLNEAVAHNFALYQQYHDELGEYIPR